MALRYKTKTEKVFDGDDEVGEVHGLSLNALVGLLANHRPEVEALFGQFQGKDPNAISEAEVSAAGFEMIEKAPVFVAQIIAAATDAYVDYEPVEGEDTPLDLIMSMPAGLQFAFLSKIGPLTFNAGGGVKKMLALALKAGQGGSQSAS